MLNFVGNQPTVIKRKKTGVIILTAGVSDRMQIAKALLPLNEKETFIEKIISTYISWGCEEIIVVANIELSGMFSSMDILPGKVKVVINEHPEYERFFSVKLGLGQIIKSEYCFIQNVDNPFITGDILDTIYKKRSSESYVSPVFKGKGGHPVLLNLKNIMFIMNYPANNSNLKVVLKEQKCKKINMKDDRVLININNQKDFENYLGKNISEWNQYTIK